MKTEAGQRGKSRLEDCRCPGSWERGSLQGEHTARLSPSREDYKTALGMLGFICDKLEPHSARFEAFKVSKAVTATHTQVCKCEKQKQCGLRESKHSPRLKFSCARSNFLSHGKADSSERHATPCPLIYYSSNLRN